MAFLAFIAFKGLKRPKKAEKKTFAKWLRIVQFGEKSNKKNFPSQNFFDLCDLGESRSLTLVAFFWEKSGFWGSRRLLLKKVLVSILCFLVSCSLAVHTPGTSFFLKNLCTIEKPNDSIIVVIRSKTIFFDRLTYWLLLTKWIN